MPASSEARRPDPHHSNPRKCVQPVYEHATHGCFALCCLLHCLPATLQVTEAFNDTQTEHVLFAQVRTFQSEHPIHICASEREGFGHYINEARAAGAFIISTDHPPMNEFVTPGV